MRFAFACVAFLSAALLFFVEPLIGKLLLPVLGGAPGVWGTCLVFFQTALLAGYAYAHVLSTRLPVRAQPIVHALVSIACAFVLPLGTVTSAPPSAQSFPMSWVLARLALLVGPPFFVISSTGPLVQRWFHLRARGENPYVLYAASNFGSLLAVVAYPLAIEPSMSLAHQRSTWSVGYALLVIGMIAIGVPLVTKGGTLERSPSSSSKTSPWRWLALAAVPSALMLASTTFVTTDIAPIPLLWVLPLALYLLSLAIPFTTKPIVSHERALKALPIAILALAFAMLALTERLLAVSVIVHFGSMFVIALACHGELARTRPSPSELTRFYGWVSLGGALGGTFCALIAPVMFPAVWEYPLAAACACFLRTSMPVVGEVEPEKKDFADVVKEIEEGKEEKKWPRWIVLVPVLVLVLVLVLRSAQEVGEETRFLILAQLGTAVCVLVWWSRQRPLRFALFCSALFFAPEIAALTLKTSFRGRSFFATHRVALDEDRHLYVQGTTIHGLQSPREPRVAGAYFHSTGPAGEVFSRLAPQHVGLIGLGVGSLATYAEKGTSFTFYEIDPVVARVAEDPSLFSFVTDARARAAKVDIVLGDARVSLAHVDAKWDLLVLDAYSSDVVPTHLLTREALALYLTKLAPNGLVLMNVSNRFLDLGRVVRALADDAHLVAWERVDLIDTPEDRRAAVLDGKAPSRWMLLSPDETRMRALGLGEEWHPLESAPRLWTDDYASVLSCVRW